MTPLRIVLADDHEVTRAGFVSMLAGCDGFDVVGQAPDRETALSHSET